MATDREQHLSDLLQIKIKEYDIVRTKYISLKEQFEKEWVISLAKDQRIYELKRELFALSVNSLCEKCKSNKNF